MFRLAHQQRRRVLAVVVLISTLLGISAGPLNATVCTMAIIQVVTRNLGPRACSVLSRSRTACMYSTYISYSFCSPRLDRGYLDYLGCWLMLVCLAEDSGKVILYTPIHLYRPSGTSIFQGRSFCLFHLIVYQVSRLVRYSVKEHPALHYLRISLTL